MTNFQMRRKQCFICDSVWHLDCNIPIDIDWARSDHEFLDSDTLDSLCR